MIYPLVGHVGSGYIVSSKLSRHGGHEVLAAGLFSELHPGPRAVSELQRRQWGPSVTFAVRECQDVSDSAVMCLVYRQ